MKNTKNHRREQQKEKETFSEHKKPHSIDSELCVWTEMIGQDATELLQESRKNVTPEIFMILHTVIAQWQQKPHN